MRTYVDLTEIRARGPVVGSKDLTFIDSWLANGLRRKLSWWRVFALGLLALNVVTLDAAQQLKRENELQAQEIERLRLTELVRSIECEAVIGTLPAGDIYGCDNQRN